MEKFEEVEKTITKRFRKEIWKKFVKAICDFEMIKEGDKIAVCISGGKDSMLMAKCFQELKKHRKMNFELEFIVMNPGYNEINKQKIIDNSKLLNIPITMFETDIFNRVVHIEDNPCYLCARMRRGYLYEKAKELGCNKIALGHHFDDVIETTLLSMLYGSEIKTMMPKLHSDNFKGIELIRPMYLIKEDAIISWKKYNELEFLDCACKITEGENRVDVSVSKRKEIKELINNLRKVNKNVDYNIFKALDNVNLNCVLGTKKDGVYESFLESYDDKE